MHVENSNVSVRQHLMSIVNILKKMLHLNVVSNQFKLMSRLLMNQFKLLMGLRDRYEAHHRVKITDEAIEAAAKMSDRYISDRFLPDKAIDLIDEAGSKVRLRSYTTPPNLKELETKLEAIRSEKNAAVQSQEFEKAASFRDKEQKIKEELEKTKKDWKEEQGKEESKVTVNDIAEVVSMWTGIPVSKIAQTESIKLLNLEDKLHERVIGQAEAVDSNFQSNSTCTCGAKRSETSNWFIYFLRAYRCRENRACTCACRSDVWR